jgi:hypothetical protein
MMSEPTVIEETIPGDWWYLAAAFGAIHKIPAPHPSRNPDGMMTYSGYTITVLHKDIGYNLGSITFSGKQGMTTIHVRVSWPEYASYWREIIERLKGFAFDARNIRRDAIAPTIDRVIELYYQIRAAGGKITLKELAEQEGVKYSYMRKRKVAYDKAKRADDVPPEE